MVSYSRPSTGYLHSFLFCFSWIYFCTFDINIALDIRRQGHIFPESNLQSHTVTLAICLSRFMTSSWPTEQCLVADRGRWPWCRPAWAETAKNSIKICILSSFALSLVFILIHCTSSYVTLTQQCWHFLKEWITYAIATKKKDRYLMSNLSLNTQFAIKLLVLEQSLDFIRLRR